MSITLDHLAIVVRDIDETLEFFAEVLGLTQSERRIDRGLDFAQVRITDHTALAMWEGENIASQHFAFAISADEFDAVYERLKAKGVSYGNAEDGYGQPTLNGKGPDVEAGAQGQGKSLYFEDPNGHRVEIMTYD